MSRSSSARRKGIEICASFCRPRKSRSSSARRKGIEIGNYKMMLKAKSSSARRKGIEIFEANLFGWVHKVFLRTEEGD